MSRPTPHSPRAKVLDGTATTPPNVPPPTALANESDPVATANVLDTTGPTAPPRRNGELVFATPWESRLFGVTMTLHGRGVFEWEEFRGLLIDAIARHERAADESWSYYACWLEALENLVVAKGVCSASELAGLTHALSARPAGHDHRHD